MTIQTEISRLNPRQKEAVTHIDGPLLVLAGAGSGKTRVIIARTAHLISKGISPKKILAVTFTNKASREMKKRVRSMLNGKTAGSPVISTFHSLCLRILRKEIGHLGYSKDFSIYNTSEQLSLMRNLMGDVHVQDRSFRVETVMERVNRTKNGLSPLSREDNDNPVKDPAEALFHSLYPKYQEALKTFNALDFDDLLLLAVRLFREYPQVLDKYREKFCYLMVDEYQDTNGTQYEFVKLLAGDRKNLCVVGDDDQSIYGWRGARLGNILDFEKDFPGAKVVRLEQNYRSIGHILKAANGVIKNNKKRMIKSLWTRKGMGPKVRLFEAGSTEEEARWVTERISRIKYEKKLKYENFAIIYRTNILSRSFEEALRRDRIPYSVIGGTSYFERKEIKDITAYLKIIANPNDRLNLLRAVCVPRRGIGPSTLEKIDSFANDRSIDFLDAVARANEVEGIGKKIAEKSVAFAELISKYKKTFENNKDMGASLKEFLMEINYEDHILDLHKTPDIARIKIENIRGFIDSLSHYETEEKEPSLLGFLETIALTDTEWEKEDKIHGVTLISFHSAKGLEFPVVFIPRAEEGIVPHRRSLLHEADIEEERRLFYVGMTRAMKELYLTYAGRKVRYGKEELTTPSRFLDEIPEEAMDTGEPEPDDPEENDRVAKAFFANMREMLGD